MALSDSITRLKSLIKNIRRRNPFGFQKEADGFKIKVEDQSFDPKKAEHSGRVYLVNLDGIKGDPKEVDKSGDDMVLEYNDKACAITSKPIEIEGNEFFFTRDGFLGTMALNQDTLLAGDVYKPSKGQYKRKVPKDVDWKEYGIDMEEAAVETTDEHYVIESEDVGDVASLHGSKKTLEEMNKAKRLRKLLEPSSIDRQKMILAVLAGITIGFVLYPRVMEQ